MLQHKKYLAAQVWFTSVANWLLGKACSHYGLPADINTFLPGVSVAVSHFVIIGLSFLQLPSIEQIRSKNALKNARSIINRQLSDPNLTPTERQRCENALAALRDKEITRCLTEVDHTYAVLAQSDSRDLEES
ncbi:TPA: hypothetical protein QCD44_002106 [Enterobacter hormaechei]|uniref:Uncharacterized protein n=1 Tax=Enterobacter mori TaxID=539813 RepID=A0A7T0DYL0_9ENTR|nr:MULTISPECIES: hypothetical protein [Enterobacter]EJQ1331320.1 hypothetical protein [Cronobacter sakazakii]EJQ1501688.1 hypothetical protein [Cronobacter sakazakii]EJQ1510418.1 hypothetical protein [Cronobacter sakazakii]EJQ1521756.1 hypothetical protein [Cronobacter sakazakii]EJR1108629.1 hypothetical protein [Cronobacter sakazakii]